MPVSWKKLSIIGPALVVVPLCSVLGMEFIQRGSLIGSVDWMIQHPMIFVLNALLVFCVLALMYSVLGSLVVSIGVTAALLSIMSLISYFKVKLIGEPFFPWDILLNKESFKIVPLVAQTDALLRIGGLIGIVALIFFLRLFVPRLSLPLTGRAALLIVSLIGLYSFGLRTPLAANLMSQAKVGEIIWNQKQNYEANGLALGFTMNIKNSIVPKPPSYSEPAMAALADHISSSSAVSSSGLALLQGKAPNVIFIMNEAFWDPTLLPNVSFSEDPAPTVHRLQKESSSGYILSPQFGGGTSNVEFEVLTGTSMSFLPGGSVPYQQYISKPLPSLASYFDDLGYKSMGIHSFDGWFWSRNSVYEKLGFESFMSKEYFDNPTYKGAFISDEEVSKQIIKEIEETDRPMFIYAVTMQNHGPYDDDRYGETSVKVQGSLSDEGAQILNTYTQGVIDADRSLQQLIEALEYSDEPTLIVFYGDHLPMLGYDYKVYAEAGFVQSGNSSEWSLEEWKGMHSVPFVTWSNFPIPKQDVPLLSTSFLGAHVLDMLQLEKTANFSLAAEVASKVPGLSNNLVMGQDQTLYSAVPEFLKEDIERYRAMQYDLMFGSNYLAKYTDESYLTKMVLSNYNEQFSEGLDENESVHASEE